MYANFKHANELYQRFLDERKSKSNDDLISEHHDEHNTLNELEISIGIVELAIHIETGHQIGEISLDMFLCIVVNLVTMGVILAIIDTAIVKFFNAEPLKNLSDSVMRFTVESGLAMVIFLPLWYFYLLPLYVDLTQVSIVN